MYTNVCKACQYPYKQLATKEADEVSCGGHLAKYFMIF